METLPHNGHTVLFSISNSRFGHMDKHKWQGVKMKSSLDKSNIIIFADNKVQCLAHLFLFVVCWHRKNEPKLLVSSRVYICVHSTTYIWGHMVLVCHPWCMNLPSIHSTYYSFLFDWAVLWWTFDRWKWQPLFLISSFSNLSFLSFIYNRSNVHTMSMSHFLLYITYFRVHTSFF